METKEIRFDSIWPHLVVFRSEGLRCCVSLTATCNIISKSLVHIRVLLFQRLRKDVRKRLLRCLFLLIFPLVFIWDPSNPSCIHLESHLFHPHNVIYVSTWKELSRNSMYLVSPCGSTLFLCSLISSLKPITSCFANPFIDTWEGGDVLTKSCLLCRNEAVSACKGERNKVIWNATCIQ